MTTIESRLNRRPDLSTFLVHLTRDKDDRFASDNLVNILSHRRLQAVTKMGKAKDHDVPNQEVVCFTETPLEHAWTLIGDIQGRQVKLEPYGLVFTKIWARSRGINPVWYMDATPGHDWLGRDVDELVGKAIANQEFDDEIFRLTPFFEVMGTWPATLNRQAGRMEFWWEREWRKVGDLTFSWDDLVAVLAPVSAHESLRIGLRENSPNPIVDSLNFLDPEWGMERMIACLAGVYSGYLGPLPRFP